MAIKQYKADDESLICLINTTTKRGKYFTKLIDKRQLGFLHGDINLIGFDKMPAGFYTKGFGLTLPGAIFIQNVSEKHGKKIKLTITSNSISKIDLRGKVIKMTISSRTLSNLGVTLKQIKRIRNSEMVAETKKIIGKTFDQFKDWKVADKGYISGSLAGILSTTNLLNDLSVEDRQMLETFIPDYLENIPGTLKSKKKLQVIFDALDAGKKIFLEKVIKEFRTKLNKVGVSENVWQKFLAEYILIFQNNYGEVLEKTSVSLQGKFPDFMLIDPYGYMDVYEIKKPDTNLLKLDASRNNHYWDVELSKAISQVENYIHQIQRHSDALMTDIRKSKAIDINIVRPRGFIVAGKRSQLTSSKMKDDFRMLCDSLKNVDVILYDDLLGNLETFIKRTNQHIVKPANIKNRTTKK